MFHDDAISIELHSQTATQSVIPGFVDNMRSRDNEEIGSKTQATPARISPRAAWRDPLGVHQAIWEEFEEEDVAFEFPPGKDRILAYRQTWNALPDEWKNYVAPTVPLNDH